MRVAIAGYGVEGEQNYRYWAGRGDEVIILDEREQLDRAVPPDAQVRLGEGSLDTLDDFDMIVRTAGLSPAKLVTQTKIWSATNEFFVQCPAPIIGVTGSKGKGTTCSLITSVLRAAGYTVHLVGNIGTPALEVIPEISPDHIVVYELSSFQLWDIERSPHFAAVLHIEPDHLDVHADFDEYIMAKSRIVAFQSSDDTCVYHPTNQWSEQIARQHPHFSTNAAKYAQRSADPSAVATVRVDGEYFVTSSGDIVAPVQALKLPGAHNIDNACAALSVCLNYEVTPEQYIQGLSQFGGLPHRLRIVAKKNSVVYYDDSIATTPGSAIAAIAAFNAPKVLLLGGSYKGADFTELASTIRDSDVRHVLLMGEETGRIAQTLEKAGVSSYEYVDGTMNDIVRRASEVAQPGDVVILSPACASFGMFRDYKDRGDQFIAAVETL